MSRISNLGDPFVFVSGNHDSDTLQRDLARRGAIVLTERGQLEPDGSYGEIVVNVQGLHLLVRGVEEMDHPRGPHGHLGDRLRRSDRKRLEEVTGIAQVRLLIGGWGPER